MLEHLPGKTLLLADTCKAGNVTGSWKDRAMVDPTAALMELEQTQAGVVVMSSSTGGGNSVESPEWGHGAFTKVLLDGLQGAADVDNNGVISFKELDLYVTRGVKKLTGGKQRPTTQIPANMPDFPIYVR